jgi:isoquinoline 1-oxidoreductase subunit beta
MTKHTKISSPDLSRRSFLVTAGASGLVFGFGSLSGATLAAAAAGSAAPLEPSIWYSIAPDGVVTVNVGKADMGQHIESTMAQIVADELGASWGDMRVNLVGNDPKYNDPVLAANITGGSWSTMMNFDMMSRVGAAGRIALSEAGAGMLGVSASDVVVNDSRVFSKASSKSVSFADIVKFGKATKTFSPDELKAIVLKTLDQYTLIGRDLPQKDIPPKINGTGKYGIDTFLPGMVYGRIVTPPERYGAKVTSADD